VHAFTFALRVLPALRRFGRFVVRYVTRLRSFVGYVGAAFTVTSLRLPLPLVTLRCVALRCVYYRRYLCIRVRVRAASFAICRRFILLRVCHAFTRSAFYRLPLRALPRYIRDRRVADRLLPAHVAFCRTPCLAGFVSHFALPPHRAATHLRSCRVLRSFAFRTHFAPDPFTRRCTAFVTVALPFVTVFRYAFDVTRLLPFLTLQWVVTLRILRTRYTLLRCDFARLVFLPRGLCRVYLLLSARYIPDRRTFTAHMPRVLRCIAARTRTLRVSRAFPRLRRSVCCCRLRYVCTRFVAARTAPSLHDRCRCALLRSRVVLVPFCLPFALRLLWNPYTACTREQIDRSFDRCTLRLCVATLRFTFLRAFACRTPPRSRAVTRRCARCRLPRIVLPLPLYVTLRLFCDSPVFSHARSVCVVPALCFTLRFTRVYALPIVAVAARYTAFPLRVVRLRLPAVAFHARYARVTAHFHARLPLDRVTVTTLPHARDRLRYRSTFRMYAADRCVALRRYLPYCRCR